MAVIVKSQPGCLTQLLWFIFVGWWLGAFAILVAYAFFITILGIPIGVWILNKIPYIMALRQTVPVLQFPGITTKQINWFLRAMWFMAIGWWAAALWMWGAYSLSMTLLLMPIGFWMFDRAPMVLTLRRR
jgi:uncharacterized membrane protein YccF (DUF307 family)